MKVVLFLIKNIHLKQYNYEAEIFELVAEEQYDVLGHRW